MSIDLTLYYSSHVLGSKFFWSSPDGNDNNPGTFEKPFLTIARVIAALEEIKATGTTQEIKSTKVKPKLLSKRIRDW